MVIQLTKWTCAGQLSLKLREGKALLLERCRWIALYWVGTMEYELSQLFHWWWKLVLFAGFARIELYFGDCYF